MNLSIDDNNTVLFFEHKGLYRSIKADVNKSLYSINLNVNGCRNN